jgi:hypothetical protein
MRVEGKFGTFGMASGIPIAGDGAIEVRDEGLVLTGFAAHRPAGAMVMAGVAMGAAAGAAGWAVGHFIFPPGDTMTVVGPAIGAGLAGAFLAVRPDRSRPRTDTIPWNRIKSVKRGAGKGPITVATQDLHPRGKDKVIFFPRADKDALVAAIDARRPR